MNNLCPWNNSVICEYKNQNGCHKCEHYKQPDENGLIATGGLPDLSSFKSDIIELIRSLQFVNWFPEWHGIHFYSSKKSENAAFNLIYKWSIFFGFWELRKFLTEDETRKRLKDYKKE
jgi:hypothetical protein